MENKSILIQSDEVTKNIMTEIQEDMINSLSKVSRNMSEDVIEKLKPLEKKINDLKGNFQEFQEEDFEEKIEDLNNNILKITKSIESTIEAAISNMVKDQNKVLFESIEERLAILGLKVVKDAANNKESILNKIDDINMDKIEEKVELMENSIEEKVELLEKSMEDNLDNNKKVILEKINHINDKIEDKDILIELINKLEGDINTKMESMQQEVEWGNKSFFARIFGKRR
ncbi:hypothetical protein DIC82_00405 [Clostridium beijerinckii]|nr:hypothetical protein DIC82_00405 [Clostridium beijerinckii]